MVRVSFLTFFAATCMSVSLLSYTQASTSGWFSSNLTIEQQDDSIYSLSLQGRDCKFRDNVPIKGIGLTAACTTEGTKLRIAYAVAGTFVSKGRDQTFYPLNIPFDRFAILSPDSDRVVLYRNINNYSSTFAVYEEASKRLEYSNGAYVFQTSQPSFQYSQSPQFFTFPRLSSDGSFAAYVGTNAANTKFAVKTVNLETGETNSIGYILDTQAYMQENYRDIAVSDDGEYVAINTYARSEDSGNLFRTIQVWRNRNCDVEASVACETRLATDNVPAIGMPSGLTFNEDASTITLMNFKQTAQPDKDDYYRATFSIEDLFATKRLDYLAMGDSFSSGEGDTSAMGSHYISGTNVLGNSLTPREMCHVSDRSYPFLLNEWLMAESKMRSIACSGAVVAHDYTGSEYGYKGQGSRLKDVPDIMRSQMKQDALDISFIPGRNKQISFVKKYQPKAVTLTGGGNDVGFGATISSCARPQNTCPEATSLLKISKIGATIQSQYEGLKSLYKTIHDKSPKTKIYVVGYPQFVSERDVTCAANVGLDTLERRLLRESVIMMNDVIEAAATAVGVKYIDIESSLGDTVLCGQAKTEYVTGITTNKTWTQLNGKDFYSSESFHPNAMGHYVMAKAIKSALGYKSLIDYSYCRGTATICPKTASVPPLTSFFKVFDRAPLQWIGDTFAQVSIQPSLNSILRISTDQLGVGNATVRMESRPRTLGVVEVGVDGVLNTDVTIPEDTEPGLHTLYIDALSPSGESVTLWQHITVFGRDGDLDGNGVDDLSQPCPFVVGSRQDGDFDGLDDRCDPEISLVGHPIDTAVPIHQVQNIGEFNVSNDASLAAKELARSDFEQVGQHFLGHDNTFASTPTLANDQTSYDKPISMEETGNIPKADHFYSSDLRANIILSISIAIVLCILTITGLIYVKSHSKKQ